MRGLIRRTHWIKATTGIALLALAVFVIGCVESRGATNVTEDSATLNGELTDLGTADSAQVSFEWGADTTYGNRTTPETLNATGPFKADITGLTPDTTYHYRARGTIGGQEKLGDDQQFTTLAGRPPEVVTNAPSQVGAQFVTLNGTLQNLGTAEVITVSFEWSADTSYGSGTTPEVMLGPGVFSTTLTGLDPGTVYHFRARAEGHGIDRGTDLVVTTLSR